MKLIVQIPCLNEEETLPQTVSDIPRRISGVDRIEILIIDDGSTDRTVEIAREIGVDHIIRHRNRKGLARAFRTGIDACLRRGADIIVNTDGDNQYCGADIPKLIAPILQGRADIVVGDRQTQTVPHFSAFKKFLQRVGSRIVSRLSNTTVPDAVSGFRAMSRDAALHLNIVSPFSYTIEMLIQAGRKYMSVESVPIRTNPKTRESRLFRSIPKFLERSLTTMVRMYSMYRPLKVFFFIGLAITLFGMLPVVRFLYFFFTGDGAGHIQSLVLGGALLVIGFMAFMIGLVADLISFNRQLLEMTLEKVRRIELELGMAEEQDTEIDDPVLRLQSKARALGRAAVTLRDKG
ncbi:MAG: glycosyltransferase family 2 protein [Rhodospirillales bacterium]|nr:MAG: glycosyltransferase family 2 protein [Rhodospirillales bacterium]